MDDELHPVALRLLIPKKKPYMVAIPTYTSICPVKEWGNSEMMLLISKKLMYISKHNDPSA